MSSSLPLMSKTLLSLAASITDGPDSPDFPSTAFLVSSGLTRIHCPSWPACWGVLGIFSMLLLGLLFLLGGAAPNLCWGSKGGTPARSWLGIVRATGPDPFRHCSRPNTHLHYMPHLRGHSCRLRCIYPLLTSCCLLYTSPSPRDRG